MAKTLISGTSLSNTYTTVYTAPTTHYTQVTMMYFGHTSITMQSGSTYGPPKLWLVSDMATGLKTMIYAGNFPYAGMTLNLPINQQLPSWGKISSEGVFIMPPGTGLQFYRLGYDLSYSFLMEEISRTIIEA